MKKKTKMIIMITAAIIAVAAIAGGIIYFISSRNDNQPPTLTEVVESRVAAYRTDLRDSYASMTDQESVAEYLNNWAENKGIKSKIDDHNNVIYSLPASDGYEDKAPVVLVTEYDHTCMGNYENSIVSAFTAAKNDEPHGEYKVIFISRKEGSLDPASALSSEYFPDGCQVIYLGNCTSSRIATVTGGYEEFLLTKDVQYTSPAYDNAYTITISGLPAQSFSSLSASDPNPIKILGDLLAYFKSHSTLFEVASFTGGTDADMLPASASVTIVVNESSLTRFENRMESEMEDFYSEYQDKYPGVQYTVEPAQMPSRVLSSQDAESLVSLMYTSPCGVHYKDDNGNVASIVNMGYINLDGSQLVLEVSASSWDEALLSEMAEIYQTTSGLSNITFEQVSQYAPFEIDESSQPFEVAFRESYDQYHSTDLESVNMAEVTPCGIIYEKNSNIESMAAGVTERTTDNFAGAVITYMRTLETAD